MLYRIHEITPRSIDKGFGIHVGYAQLCSSITDGSEVRNALIKAGLFPADWGADGRVALIKYQSIKCQGCDFHTSVLQIISPERGTQTIAYLYPVPSKKDIIAARIAREALQMAAAAKSKWYTSPLAYYTTSASTTAGTGTYQYITNYPR